MVCLQEHVEESTIIDIWKAIPGSNPGKDREEFDSFHLLMQNGRIFDLRKYDSRWRWKRASIRKSTLTMWRNAEKEQDSSKWQRQFARVSSVGGYIDARASHVLRKDYEPPWLRRIKRCVLFQCYYLPWFYISPLSWYR